MKKNILIILLFGIVFMYGVAVGVKRIFPYNQIKYVKKSLFGVPVGSCQNASISNVLLDDNKSRSISYWCFISNIKYLYWFNFVG